MITTVLDQAAGAAATAAQACGPTTCRIGLLGLGNVGSAFARMTRRRGVDLATVNLCCSVSADGVTRFAFGAVGPRPFAVRDDSGLLADASADQARQESALRNLAARATPISNVRASREYRAAMLLVLARRALLTARERLHADA